MMNPVGDGRYADRFVPARLIRFDPVQWFSRSRACATAANHSVVLPIPGSPSTTSPDGSLEAEAR
jgi:hypothetical protein